VCVCRCVRVCVCVCVCVSVCVLADEFDAWNLSLVFVT